MPTRHRRAIAITRAPGTLAALLALAALAVPVLAEEPAAEPAAETATPLHQVSSEVCASCHAVIYQQWSDSMHAKSTALSNPLHGAFYRAEVGSPTEAGQKHLKSGTFPICLSCHAPNAFRDQTTKLDAMAAYQEGVNCVACHTLAGYKGYQGEDGKLKLGLKAYELSDTLQAPAGQTNGLASLTAASGDDPLAGAGVGGSDAKRPNPHLGAAVELEGKPIPSLPMEANPRLMKTSDACMGCHGQRDNPQGVPLCQTGNEYLASASQVNCLSCHMPVVDGIASHSMDGGYDPAMVKRAVVFDITTQPDGETLKTAVYLHNQLPHALPTGAPFRNLFVKLTAYDKDGNALWQNAQKHPVKEDPQAYMSYAMVDDKGLPVPPPMATKAGDDTRLKPHEERTLEYTIPAKDVVLVRGELYYSLLWPSLVEKFTSLPDEIKAPVLIAVSERPVASE